MPKKTTKTEPKAEIVVEVPSNNPTKSSIQPISETFGNGDLNILKDKINEIINRG